MNQKVKYLTYSLAIFVLIDSYFFKFPTNIFAIILSSIYALIIVYVIYHFAKKQKLNELQEQKVDVGKIKPSPNNSLNLKSISPLRYYLQPLINIFESLLKISFFIFISIIFIAIFFQGHDRRKAFKYAVKMHENCLAQNGCTFIKPPSEYSNIVVDKNQFSFSYSDGDIQYNTSFAGGVNKKLEAFNLKESCEYSEIAKDWNCH
jgi:hypothetical protein